MDGLCLPITLSPADSPYCIFSCTGKVENCILLFLLTYTSFVLHFVMHVDNDMTNNVIAYTVCMLLCNASDLSSGHFFD